MGASQGVPKAHSLVDDVVCQGVCYCFEVGVFEDGRHSTAMIRPADIDGPVLGGLYADMDAMVARAPADLLEQGVPPSVVSYVVDSLNLFVAYR